MLLFLRYFVGMCGDGANDCGALKAGKFSSKVYSFKIFLLANLI